MLTRFKRLVRRFIPPRLASRTAMPGLAADKGFAETQLPDWRSILDTNRPLWERSLAQARTGPRVLIATYVGAQPQFTVLESALAAALTLRGAKVSLLLCDEALPGCLRAKITAVAPKELGEYRLAEAMCRSCVHTGKTVFDGLGLEILGVKSSLTTEDLEEAREVSELVPFDEIARFQWRGLPVGEHAVAGALRYFSRGDIENEPEGESVVRRYLEASIRSARAIERQLEAGSFTSVVINHAIYTPHGVAAAASRSRGARVVAWNLAYRKQCAIFSHGDTYHHTLMSEPVAEWENLPWSAALEKKTLDYLESRKQGAGDWIWFHKHNDADLDRLAREKGLDWTKPVVGMLTNVVWDAQLHYPANAFPNMVDWAVRTVDYFAKRPELQLLIRLHPGEIAKNAGATGSRQPMEGEIRRAFPSLPKNVFIIGSDDPLDTYAAMSRCNAAIVYGTKTGVELASRGVPVIAAGEAWIRNKGISLDASSAQEYFAILDRLPLKEAMAPAAVERARKYAFHFFFRRMIPFSFLEPSKGWPPYNLRVAKLDDLLPGRDRGLDVACDGILHGAPFIFPAETLN